MGGLHDSRSRLARASKGVIVVLLGLCLASCAGGVLDPLGPVGADDAQILIDAGAQGRAVTLLPDAREALRLPPAQRIRKPVPDYGRGADAKPMSTVARQRTSIAAR